MLKIVFLRFTGSFILLLCPALAIAANHPATVGQNPGSVALHLSRAPSIDVSLENVFDERYEDHLTGINRVLGSDVPVGARIPGPGRFVAVSIGYKF
ncbi:MAG: hypothetical protein ABI674_09300 [Spartobacteria bacterium]